MMNTITEIFMIVILFVSLFHLTEEGEPYRVTAQDQLDKTLR